MRDGLSRTLRQERALAGHGVIIGPNVHAVRAWAVRKTLTAKERDADRYNGRNAHKAGEG